MYVSKKMRCSYEKISIYVSRSFSCIINYRCCSSSTLPTLNNNSRNASIGPKLAKTKAIVEQANLTRLNDQRVDLLTDAGNYSLVTVANSSLKGLQANAINGFNEEFILDAGIVLLFNRAQVGQQVDANTGLGTLTVDINGTNDNNGRPNRVGEGNQYLDRYTFDILNSGRVVPTNQAAVIMQNGWRVPRQ